MTARRGHAKGAHIGGVVTLEDVRQRCVIDEDNGCWHWRTARGRPYEPCSGRPMVVWFHPAGKQMTVTRLVWHLTRVREPGQRQVVYRCCESHDCVNPAHLSLGTHKQMMAAVVARGGLHTLARRRMHEALKRSSRARQEKTTPADRLAITLSSDSSTVLAERYGISSGRVRVIRSRGRSLLALASPFGVGAHG